MSSHDSKSKTNLDKIGADAFALLEDFSGGHKSKPKHWLSKQVYVAPVQELRNETVVDCYEAAKRYGGTVIVDYPKWKPARKGFFY